MLSNIIAFLSIIKAQAQAANYKNGSEVYFDLSEQALNHVIKLDFDACTGMHADVVGFWFTDGYNNTRTKLVGKKVGLTGGITVKLLRMSNLLALTSSSFFQLMP